VRSCMWSVAMQFVSEQLVQLCCVAKRLPVAKSVCSTCYCLRGPAAIVDPEMDLPPPPAGAWNPFVPVTALGSCRQLPQSALWSWGGGFMGPNWERVFWSLQFSCTGALACTCRQLPLVLVIVNYLGHFCAEAPQTTWDSPGKPYLWEYLYMDMEGHLRCGTRLPVSPACSTDVRVIASETSTDSLDIDEYRQSEDAVWFNRHQ
jgi:hypothetical protein